MTISALANTDQSNVVKLPTTPEGELAVLTRRAEHNVQTARQLAIAHFRHALIRMALQATGDGRKKLITQLTRGEHTLPDGTCKRLSKTTLYAWMRGYEQNGLMALVPKVRTDKGATRINVSRAWDQLLDPHLPVPITAQIAAELTHYIRSLWGSGARGWRQCTEFASSRLYELTVAALAEHPVTITADALYDVCVVPRSRVEVERDHSLVATSTDAKRYHDQYLPRIRRDYSQLKPRELVVGDVHPIDICCKRDDGSEVYPRAIAWLDAATNEIWMTLIFLAKGEGVRRQHVAWSFASMCAAWGLPNRLYLDNGSEYNWAEMIDGFTRLAGLCGEQFGCSYLGDDPSTARHIDHCRNHIIRSRPYNAAGKPKIEGAFAVLEQGFFALIDGWVGGDRMNKKTHRVGQAPIAFAGTPQAFQSQVEAALTWYHQRRQHGSLAGLSPNATLLQHIDNGWGKVAVDEATLLVAFAHEVTRKVDRGYVSVALPGQPSRLYYHDHLLPHTGHKLCVRVAAHQPELAFVFDNRDVLVCVAEPDQRYHPLDPAGAAEQARRAKVLRRKIADRKQHSDRLDLIDELQRHSDQQPNAPEIPIASSIKLTDLDEMVRGLDAADDTPLLKPDTPVDQWGVNEQVVIQRQLEEPSHD